MIYLITDRLDESKELFLEKIGRACSAQPAYLQLREKELTGRTYYDLALDVKTLADRWNVPLIVDDRLDVALAVGAAGVHLGAQDIPLAAARRLLPPGALLGATAKTVQAALTAQEDGADYLGVGAIFPTTTKVKTVLTSVQTLKAICSAVTIPVFAIGGLNATNMGVLKGAGVAGLAVVSAVMKAADPAQALRGLKKAFDDLND